MERYRKKAEWKPGSTLSLYKSDSSLRQISVPEDVDTFLKKYELILPLQLKKPVELLSPHGLKTLSKICNERKHEWSLYMHNKLSQTVPNTDLNLISDALSDSLLDLSITSFIKNEFKFKDPHGKLEKELQIAGINTTDEILVVDLMQDEKILISQFKETIRELKEKRQIPNKASKVSESKLAKLSTYMVLPYIDLIFWGEHEKLQFSEELLDAVLFPRGIYTTDNSKNLANEALSIPFLQSLN